MCKVGDKVYCKKSFYIGGYNLNFTEGKYYYINRVEVDMFYILSDGNAECDFEYGDYTNNNYEFKDHFYTEKELRKMKLEKISE